uniref:Uncharacterized protein n=1 Tax=Pipistrellus kuhlii TaxID=59472 RepID=A0A7J8B1Y4_PIPKU|nr:hypothetical protein mPipKuh1_007896 [Pipistrellus kuhlii]
MLAGKKDVTPGSETQDFITHCESSSQNFLLLFFCLNPPCPPISRGQCQEPGWMPALQRKNTERGGIIIFMANKSKPTLVPEGAITASPKVAASANTTLSDGPDCQCLAFLEYPGSMFRDIRGPWDGLSQHALQSH